MSKQLRAAGVARLGVVFRCLSLRVASTLLALGSAALAQEPEHGRKPVDPAASELPCVDPPADGISVTVIDAASGTPVGGAFVTWFEEGSSGSCFVPEPDLRDQRRRFGKTVRTAADGTTRIGAAWCVVATAGERCAASHRVHPGRPTVLALKPNRSIVVKTVDVEGRPLAHVPIALRRGDATSDSGQDWNLATGLDGVARIGPLDLYVEFVWDRARDGLWVGVDAPLAKPLGRSFKLTEIPATPIEFKLPPTGRVVIDVVDAQGLPIDQLGSTSVGAPWKGLTDEASATTSAIRWPGVRWFTYDRRSHYELPYVETGLRLVVDTDRELSENAKQTLDGPHTTGDTVTVRLVAPPLDEITGRIVDEKGEPVVGRQVALLAMSKRSRLGRRRIAAGTTDLEGRIRATTDSMCAATTTPPTNGGWKRWFLGPTETASSRAG